MYTHKLGTTSLNFLAGHKGKAFFNGRFVLALRGLVRKEDK